MHSLTFTRRLWLACFGFAPLGAYFLTDIFTWAQQTDFWSKPVTPEGFNYWRPWLCGWNALFVVLLISLQWVADRKEAPGWLPKRFQNHLGRERAIAAFGLLGLAYLAGTVALGMLGHDFDQAIGSQRAMVPGDTLIYSSYVLEMRPYGLMENLDPHALLVGAMAWWLGSSFLPDFVRHIKTDYKLSNDGNSSQHFLLDAADVREETKLMLDVVSQSSHLAVGLRRLPLFVLGLFLLAFLAGSPSSDSDADIAMAYPPNDTPAPLTHLTLAATQLLGTQWDTAIAAIYLSIAGSLMAVVLRFIKFRDLDEAAYRDRMLNLVHQIQNHIVIVGSCEQSQEFGRRILAMGDLDKLSPLTTSQDQKRRFLLPVVGKHWIDEWIRRAAGEDDNNVKLRWRDLRVVDGILFLDSDASRFDFVFDIGNEIKIGLMFLHPNPLDAAKITNLAALRDVLVVIPAVIGPLEGMATWEQANLLKSSLVISNTPNDVFLEQFTRQLRDRVNKPPRAIIVESNTGSKGTQLFTRELALTGPSSVIVPEHFMALRMASLVCSRAVLCQREHPEEEIHATLFTEDGLAGWLLNQIFGHWRAMRAADAKLRPLNVQICCLTSGSPADMAERMNSPIRALKKEVADQVRFLAPDGKTISPCKGSPELNVWIRAATEQLGWIESELDKLWPGSGTDPVPKRFPHVIACAIDGSPEIARRLIPNLLTVLERTRKGFDDRPKFAHATHAPYLVVSADNRSCSWIGDALDFFRSQVFSRMPTSAGKTLDAADLVNAHSEVAGWLAAVARSNIPTRGKETLSTATESFNVHGCLQQVQGAVARFIAKTQS